MVRDLDLWHRAQDCIGQNVLTNSKSPRSHIMGISPKYVKQALDSVLISADGKRYVDYICGLGTNVLGYGNQIIINEIQKHLPFMGSHSLPTDKEVIAAEKLKEVIPFMDKVKFLKTGSEACQAAIKIARANTGRMKILSDGYHGWSDHFISLMDPAEGVWKGQNVYPLMSSDDIDQHTACVIIEPVITDYGPKRREYLEKLRKKCDETGAMLIYDEVITGFRVPHFSFARYFNIYPDLLILGKGLANGLPLSAVMGSKKVMDYPGYFVSSTYAGETLSLVACAKTIETLQKDPFYSIETLWEKGAAFIEKFNSFYPTKIWIEGYPTRGIFKGDENVIALFFQEAARAGLLFCRSWFYNAHHPQDDDLTLPTIETILKKIARREITLSGEAPLSPLALMQRLKDGKK